MDLFKSGYLLALFFLLSAVAVKGQSKAQLATYLDLGSNNVSDGLFIRTAGLGSYQKGKFHFDGGLQFELKNTSGRTFTGAKILGGREFIIKDFSFEAQGLFMYNPFSDLLYEMNWGVLLKAQRKHFFYKLGTNFRSYHIPKSISDDNLQGTNALQENWNLMYLVGYNLKPIDHKWNVGISVTNIDHFIINQETNPVLYLQGKYQVSKPLTLFSEAWYKSAGAFNISVNHFGYFFRTGLIWQLDLEK